VRLVLKCFVDALVKLPNSLRVRRDGTTHVQANEKARLPALLSDLESSLTDAGR
jgi:hypothetical protein